MSHKPIYITNVQVPSAKGAFKKVNTPIAYVEDADFNKSMIETSGLNYSHVNEYLFFDSDFTKVAASNVIIKSCKYTSVNYNYKFPEGYRISQNTILNGNGDVEINLPSDFNGIIKADSYNSYYPSCLTNITTKKTFSLYLQIWSRRSSHIDDLMTKIYSYNGFIIRFDWTAD